MYFKVGLRRNNPQVVLSRVWLQMTGHISVLKILNIVNY